MSRRISESRRNFLKTSAVGAANLAVAGVVKKTLAASQAAPFKQINREIDNLRVVCCHDPEMVDGDPTRWNTIADQNGTVDVDRVQNNLDRMAMSLAEKNSSAEAWATIFTKPDSKQWSEVRAAIKANCKTNSGRHSNNPRLAVLDKICKELNNLGIPFGSIVIYDGDDEEANKPYGNYVGNGLPSGVIVSKQNSSLGGTTQAQIPAPWNKSDICTKDIAEGNIDILVNITVNKGSHNWTGPATLCMKNHYGTFGIGSPDHAFNYMIGISKSDAIVGGTPPRQQLCIVDTIWASVSGPAAEPNKKPYKLVMGTCAPVVDYLTVKKIREDDMNANHTSSIINKYMTEFGFSTSDVTDFIYVDPTPIKKSGQTAKPKKVATLQIITPNRGSISFNLTSHARPIFIDIHDLQGRTIQSLSFTQSSEKKLQAAWDGLDTSGATVGTGMYLVTVRQNGKKQSKKIRVVR